MRIWCNSPVVRAGAAIVIAVTSLAAMSPGGKAPAPNKVVALKTLEKGQWELRELDETPALRSKPKRICIGEPSQLFHPLYGGANCRRFVVSDEEKHAVVTYECKGAGYGRTDLRVETPRLVQIDAQGVANGAPFSVSMEARRTGDCR